MIRHLIALFSALTVAAAESGSPVGKFQQLDQTVPTPSPQRNASGAPGAAYWQNRADYDIRVELDDVKRTLKAEATVTYHNASPDQLTYLWVQLDQNYLSHNADSRAAPNIKRGVDLAKFSYPALDRLLAYEDYDGEMKISKLTDAEGKALPHAVVKTMLRLDLPEPLAPGADSLIMPSRHTHNAGGSNAPRLLISSSPWRMPAVSTSTGSGEAGSTVLITWMCRLMK